MTFGTHVAFASVLYLGGATLFGYKPDGIGWLLAAAASCCRTWTCPPPKSEDCSGASPGRWSVASATAPSPIASLDAEVINGLYAGSCSNYLARFNAAADALVKGRYLVKSDADSLKAWAITKGNTVIWGNGKRCDQCPITTGLLAGCCTRARGIKSCLLPCVPDPPLITSPPPAPSAPARRTDVGVKLGDGDALVAEQGLDVHQLRPGVEQVGGVGVAQFVGADLLLDAGLLQHEPQVGARRLRRHRLLPRRAAERLHAPGAPFNQNPNTAPKASGRGARRSFSPFPTTRTDLAAPATRRTSEAFRPRASLMRSPPNRYRSGKSPQTASSELEGAAQGYFSQPGASDRSKADRSGWHSGLARLTAHHDEDP